MLFDIINLLTENSLRARVAWVGQGHGEQELVQREHSRPGEEIGKRFGGSTSRVSEGHWSVCDGGIQKLS